MKILDLSVAVLMTYALTHDSNNGVICKLELFFSLMGVDGQSKEVMEMCCMTKHSSSDMRVTHS